MDAREHAPQSWGRYPKVKPRQVTPVFWRSEIPDLKAYSSSVLPFACGRSYGDSCLNADGVTLDVSHLNRFISFDESTGVLCCEAGVKMADILEVMVPRGWFLPVTPGTKFVSVGGAIANDIHGKNHHCAGTFGCHVVRFKLLRSNGQRLTCSPTQNAQLFRATIGGLGLTGLILWAEIQLKPIRNPFIRMEQIRYRSLAEFIALSNDSDTDFEYTVAWVDCLAGGAQLGRGLFLRGNHDETAQGDLHRLPHKLALSVPVDLPSFVLNTLSMKAFNELYYHAQRQDRVRKLVYYDPFFYPLDALHSWNRMYGKRGFLQYQCVVPLADGYDVMSELLRTIHRSGEGSFLTVLKKFGDIRSPGMLSFPRPGLTLALDFPNNGKPTLTLLEKLDSIVRASGGAVYPAKDARMTAESFQRYYPQWEQFEPFIDVKFSSSFWRRVTHDTQLMPVVMYGQGKGK
jgi:FAD/FMN-containing dehydrogenase